MENSAQEEVGAPGVEEVFVDGEVSGSDPDHTQPDPGFTTSKSLKDETKKAENESKDGLHKLKSTLIISAAVVAVVGALCAIVKKIREA